MRKSGIYIFTTLYIFSCLGITIDYHYCGGELQSIALYHVDEDGCCGEDDEKEMDCCHDTYLIVDTDESESLKTCCFVKDNYLQNVLVNNQNPLSIIGNRIPNRLAFLPLDHAPPNITEVPIFIKNRILLI